MQGIVLAEVYSDQVTMGASNVMDLQCWAGKLNMKVVEPFLVSSFFRTHPLPDSLRFSNTFNITYWNGFCEKRHFGSLISWKQFLCQAPRSLILVYIKFQSYEVCHRSGSDWTKMHGFRVVKKVCIDMSKTGGLMTADFNSRIFGKFAPRRVTVLFLHSWNGIRIRREQVISAQRLLLNDNTCGGILRNMYPSGIHSMNWTELDGNVALFPSNKVLKHTEEYTRRYLHNNNYIAVMVRMEHFLHGLKGDWHTDCGTSINACVDKAISLWKDMRRKSGLHVTFLASDMGRYGTQMQQVPPKYVTKIFRTLINSTLEEYHTSFKTVTGKNSTERGYISVLQKTLASRAKCLLLLGGGSFQAHTLHLYKELHPAQEQCYDILR